VKSYSRTSPPIGLLTIAIGFLLLVTLLIVFSRQLVENVSDLTAPAGTIAVVAVIALPLFLLGLIIFQTVRLLRDRARRGPGALLKSRFILFITTLVLLATVPLELISFNFIDLASKFWLTAGIQESIDGATGMALDYYRATVDNLQSFTQSSLLTSFLAGTRRNAAAGWRSITQANAFVHFIQVFDDGGAEIAFFVSDEHADASADVRLASLQELRRQRDIARIDRRSLSFIRARLAKSVEGRAYNVAVGTLLSPGFSQTSNRLSSAGRCACGRGLQCRHLPLSRYCTRY
jgi:nitrogen fixation/metabolism regulation signal transduction histidine kinase